MFAERNRIHHAYDNPVDWWTSDLGGGGGGGLPGALACQDNVGMYAIGGKPTAIKGCRATDEPEYGALYRTRMYTGTAFQVF